MESLPMPNPEEARGRQSYSNLEVGLVETAASQECGLLWGAFRREGTRESEPQTSLPFPLC